MSRSIPTRYNGVTFRSRLEARWAAMFDLLGWKWDYEPLDLKGYIPDFILNWHRPMLVEVKPIIDWKDGQFSSAARKIEKSGWRYEAVVVGASLVDRTELGGVGIGRICQGGDPTTPKRVSNGAAIISCPDCGTSFCDDVDLYHCRRCDEQRYGGHPPLFDVAAAESLWRKAGNLVQWMGADAQPWRKTPAVVTEPPVPIEEVQSFFGNLSQLLDDD